MRFEKHNKALYYEIIKNKELLFYTLLKYLEFASTGLTFFLLAKKVNPEEYGKATILFLGISYFTIFFPGIYQFFVKNFAKGDNEVQINLEVSTLITSCLFSLIIIILFPIIINHEISLIGAFIVLAKYIQDFFINIFRVSKKLTYINIITTLSSLFLLLLFYFLTQDINTFFFWWMVSSWTGVFSGLILYLRTTKVKKHHFKVDVYFKNLRHLIKESYLLSILGIFSILAMNFDRIFSIWLFPIPIAVLGNMQFADNIATIVSYGFSTIVFAITPSLITKLNEGSLEKKVFINNGYFALFVVTALSLLLVLLLNQLIPNYFPQYNETPWLIYFYVLLKLLALGLFIPSTLGMLYNIEYQVLTVYFLSFFVINFLFSLLTLMEVIRFPYFAILLINIFCLLFLNAYYYIYFKYYHAKTQADTSL